MISWIFYPSPLEQLVIQSRILKNPLKNSIVNQTLDLKIKKKGIESFLIKDSENKVKLQVATDFNGRFSRTHFIDLKKPPGFLLLYF